MEGYETTENDEFGLFDRPNMTGTPERRLLLAILERALLDYVGNDDREAEEAQDWIFGDFGPTPHPQFSFPWICEQLDLDMDRTLNKIKQMEKRGASRLAPWYLTKPKAVSAS